jgi:hypothetical protein
MNLTSGRGEVYVKAVAHSCPGYVVGGSEIYAGFNSTIPLKYVRGNSSVFVNFTYRADLMIDFHTGTCRATSSGGGYRCYLDVEDQFWVQAWIYDLTSNNREDSPVTPFPTLIAGVSNNTTCQVYCSVGNTSYGNVAPNSEIAGSFSLQFLKNSPMNISDQYAVRIQVFGWASVDWGFSSGAKLVRAHELAAVDASGAIGGFRLKSIVER